MTRNHRPRQASHGGACFVFTSVLLFAPTAIDAAQAPCGPSRIDDHARVSYVYDGDTVRLADGRKLRLIGVNTPERARDHQPGQPLAEAARSYLQHHLKQATKISLQYGIESRDRHGRVLAHVFLASGENLGRRLLLQGYGLALTVPPNLALLDCYRAAEQTARRHRRGVWGHAYFSPLSPDQLTAKDRGFRRVGGVVSRVSEQGGDIWLQLSPRFSFLVRESDRIYFPSFAASDWLGQHLVVRGWLQRRRDGWQMKLRHPAALENITQTKP